MSESLIEKIKSEIGVEYPDDKERRCLTFEDGLRHAIDIIEAMGDASTRKDEGRTDSVSSSDSMPSLTSPTKIIADLEGEYSVARDTAYADNNKPQQSYWEGALRALGDVTQRMRNPLVPHPAAGADTLNDCRAAFEKWCAAKGLDMTVYTDSWSEKCRYQHSHINAMWNGWKASWNQCPSEANKRYAERETSEISANTHVKYDAFLQWYAKDSQANINDAYEAWKAAIAWASTPKREIGEAASIVYTKLDSALVENEELREALRLILPLAKGYAAAHSDVKSNIARIERAASLIESATPALESGEAKPLADQGCVHCNPIKLNKLLGDPRDCVTVEFKP